MAAEQQPIHQIIATHCTYDNNAINPRTGELEDHARGGEVTELRTHEQGLVGVWR